MIGRLKLHSGSGSPSAARRGLGSNLYALGVPEKAIQEILRQCQREHNKHVLYQDDAGADHRSDGET